MNWSLLRYCWSQEMHDYVEMLICLAINDYCKLPVVQTGSFVGSITTLPINGTSNFTCSPGYEGSGEIKCVEDNSTSGKLVPEPACKRIVVVAKFLEFLSAASILPLLFFSSFSLACLRFLTVSFQIFLRCIGQPFQFPLIGLVQSKALTNTTLGSFHYPFYRVLHNLGGLSTVRQESSNSNSKMWKIYIMID